MAPPPLEFGKRGFNFYNSQGKGRISFDYVKFNVSSIWLTLSFNSEELSLPLSKYHQHLLHCRNGIRKNALMKKNKRHREQK